MHESNTRGAFTFAVQMAGAKPNLLPQQKDIFLKKKKYALEIIYPKPRV